MKLLTLITTLLMLGLSIANIYKSNFDTCKLKEAIQTRLPPYTIIKKLNPATQEMRSWQNLRPSLLESYKYLTKKDPNKLALTYPIEVTWGDLKFTIEKMLQILPELDRDKSVLMKYFNFVRMDTFLFTAYYHPILEASQTPKDGFVPIYKVPKQRKKFSRQEIMEGALNDQKLELAYVKDKFEAFILEVQGSGCLKYPDKTECVKYAGQNGRKYKSSRRILEEHGLLKKADINSQRQFFTQHPEYLTLLAENPSYVFFEKTSQTQAIGAMGRPLHGWQSIAVDRRILPLGSLISVNLPEINFTGLMLAQDTGGAIKGKRIDLFCGASDKARDFAATLDTSGQVWLILARR